MKAANKGKHILCEKPAALSSNDIKQMKQECKKTMLSLWKVSCIFFVHSMTE
ncbi:Gfo/Idh/MocA family oxidoreductase [Virgibacillus natechei]